MNEVTFKKAIEFNGYVASTGEGIEYITSKQFGLVATTGWYIIETNGDMTYNRFATLKDAKYAIIRRHNIMQAAEITFAKAEKVLAKYNSAKVGA